MLYGMTKSRGIRIRRGTRLEWVSEQQGQHICGCGCGEPIIMKPQHFSTGIPAYRLGHYSRIANPNPKREPVPRKPCECDCGELAGPGKRFISGHNRQGRRHSAKTRQKLSEGKQGKQNPMFGKRPARWNGGRYPDKAGYIMRTVKNHPFAPFDKIREHRLVMERYLRKRHPDSPYLTEVNGTLYLRPEIIVHHGDEVHDNNAISNLTPMTPGEHRAWHNRHRHPHK
jgi:hypothetical protein